MALPAPADGAASGCYFGVYPAIVTDLVDPDDLGRIEVRFPALGVRGDSDVRAWATLCTPYADDQQGLAILPDVDSQVVVAFEAGHWERPYIIGAAWNGTTTLPHAPEAANNIRLLRSRRDSRLEFDDSPGTEKVRITMANGNRVELDNSTQQVTVAHQNGCVVRLTVAGTVEISGNTAVNVTAPQVQVTSPMSTFTGVVQAQTVIAQAFVISPAYTPGVGNIW
jgi:uncharacterized protein involved in type VI secretion and phage assembly